LIGVDVRRRAWALELLENVLPPEEHAYVAPQIEALTGSPRRGDVSRFTRDLGLLCTSDDYALRTCARRVARQRGLWPNEILEDDMSDNTLRKLFALEGVEIFAQNDVDDLMAVAAVARERSFRAGERVYAEGDPGDALYVVVEGTAEARRDGDVILTIGTKESFGETSLFDGAPRINEVIATAALRVLVIDRRDFLDLIGDRPELLGGMFRVLSRQLKSIVVEAASRKVTVEDHPALESGVRL
jgi:hypothetical protein